jgi:hypothetical protein
MRNGSSGESDYYGESIDSAESGDEYGDRNINYAFETKFGPLKRFAINVHTGKYDNDIDLELRTDVINENDGNLRKLTPLIWRRGDLSQ